MKRETKKTLGIALIGLMGINLTGSALAMQPGDHLASLTQNEPSMNYLDSIERNQKCNVLSQAGSILGDVNWAKAHAFDSNKKSNSILDKSKNAANYIIDTIKGDLGLQAPIDLAYPLDDNESGTNLGFLEGCRLFIYDKAISYLIWKSLINFAPNFVSEACYAAKSENHPLDRINIVEYVIHACITAPVLEEALFTYGLSTVVGPKLSRVVVPLLFGLVHYHPNPKAHLVHMLFACPGSFIYTSNNYGHIKRGTGSFASIWAHALWNASAIYPKVLRELKGQ